MLTIPEQPEPIDWSHYRKNITTPGLVDNFQKQFESLTVPYPKDTETPRIEKHRKEFVSLNLVICSLVLIRLLLLLFDPQEDDVARVTKEAEKNLESLKKQVS